MLPVIITASDRIDTLYTVDARVRSSIANALQVSYFIAREINLSVRESIEIWGEIFAAVSEKSAAFAELHRQEFEWLCQGVMGLISFALLLWQQYNSTVDAFVASCEKSEDEAIAESLEDLGIARVEMLRVFTAAFCESFAVEPAPVMEIPMTASPDLDSMTLRELWQVAKGKVSGFRRMSKQELVSALSV